MVNIITDSTSDLGPSIVAEFGIMVVPLMVTIGGRVYRDGVDINQTELFQLVEQVGELPKTAAPSVGEFIAAFDLPGESIFIGISSRLSATIQNAKIAAESFPSGKVRVIDSLNLSSGVGLLALRGAELRSQGVTAQGIEKELLVSAPKLRTSFVIETMQYLYKGGRCTALQAIVGSMLQIHPVIDVRSDGTLGVKSKVRGTMQKGLQFILDCFESDLPILDDGRIFVTSTSINANEIQYLVDGIKRITHSHEVRVTRAGSVVSSHCGPGTSGILYFVK
jgi:DegV family protein with EDD domain